MNTYLKTQFFDILLILNVNHDFIPVVLHLQNISKLYKKKFFMIFIFLKEFNLHFFCASCNFRARVEILKEEVKVGLVLEVVQEIQVPRDLKDILVSTSEVYILDNGMV